MTWTLCSFGGDVRNGCERRGSNPHEFPHWNLNPARLPIPPRSRYCSSGDVCLPALFCEVERLSYSARPMSMQARRAVLRLKELVLAGDFERAATLDVTTGDLLDNDARALFAALPALTAATAPEEIVDFGLLERTPRGLSRALAEARYVYGRELFVETTVSHRVRDPQRPVGEYRSDAPLTFTHRAKLVGEHDEQFVLELEGAPHLLRVAKADIYAWNEACGVAPSGGMLSGVNVDYNEPLLKAQICAALIDNARDIDALDFGVGESVVAAKQERLLRRLASRQRTRFSGADGYSGNKAGALFTSGVAGSFAQRAVAAGYLQAFSRLLGFDVQVCNGRTIGTGTPHGFLVVTFRPSTYRVVCDPAWREPATAVPVAFFGPSWGHDRRVESFEGTQQLTVYPESIRLPELAP